MQTISRVLSHYSLCNSIIKADKLMEKAAKLGVKSIILADQDSLSGAVEFMGEASKKGIKPIVGVTLSITDDNLAPQGTLTLVAKNLNGWKQLLKLVSRANSKEFHGDHPRLPFSQLTESSDLIAIVGGYNSILAHKIVDHEARFSDSIESAKQFVYKDEVEWTRFAQEQLKSIQSLYGVDSVYIEIMHGISRIQDVLNRANRWLAKQCGAKCIPSNPVHYLEQEDWWDFIVMMCVGLKIKKAQLTEVKDVEHYQFRCGADHYLNISDDSYLQEDIDNLDGLAEKCEVFNVFSNPKLPEFKWTGGLSEPDYLRQLCRNGWKTKIEGKITKKIDEYSGRVKDELDTVKDVDDLLGEPLLSRYFLIVQDYVNWAKNKNIYVGPGRGSSGGCMVSYLQNITEIDPIRFDLIFSRFFNPGRISKDKFSLPDIDIDFEINRRQEVIQYITERYGKERVGQVITFNRLQGRGAMKEVLRINEACTIDEMNKITSYIPDEAKIADDLQEMKDSGEEVSIILWALQNNREKLAKWCYIDDNGKFQGEYARLFEQAVRLEGTLKATGKHAAAVVVSAFPLEEVCPLAHNKSSDDLLAGIEYGELEKMGILKCDILAVAAFTKLSETKKLIEEMGCLKA